MAYTPPAGNTTALVFETGSYAPPRGDLVALEFGPDEASSGLRGAFAYFPSTEGSLVFDDTSRGSGEFDYVPEVEGWDSRRLDGALAYSVRLDASIQNYSFAPEDYAVILDGEIEHRGYALDGGSAYTPLVDAWADHSGYVLTGGLVYTPGIAATSFLLLTADGPFDYAVVVAGASPGTVALDGAMAPSVSVDGLALPLSTADGKAAVSVGMLGALYVDPYAWGEFSGACWLDGQAFTTALGEGEFAYLPAAVKGEGFSRGAVVSALRYAPSFQAVLVVTVRLAGGFDYSPSAFVKGNHTFAEAAFSAPTAWLEGSASVPVDGAVDAACSPSLDGLASVPVDLTGRFDRFPTVNGGLAAILGCAGELSHSPEVSAGAFHGWRADGAFDAARPEVFGMATPRSEGAA